MSTRKTACCEGCAKGGTCENAAMSMEDIIYYRLVGQAKTPQQLDDAFARGRLRVGQVVSFKSGSAPGGWRRGTIIKLGRRRATVKFRWLSGNRAESTKTVPFMDILERRREEEAKHKRR
jgi:hypothetical protein